MELQITPPMLVNVVIFVVSTGLAIYGVRMRSDRGSNRSELTAFIALMLGISVWELCNIWIDAVTTSGTKLLATNVINAVGAPLFLYPVIWFVLAYSDNERWVYPWLSAAAVTHIATLSAVFALDPEFMYEVEGLVTRGPVQFLTVTFEPWVGLNRDLKGTFMAYQLFVYVTQLFALGLLVRYLFDNRDRLQTGQVLSLLAGILAALGGNMLLFLGLVPPDLNPTDLAFGVLALCFAVAIFRYRLFEIVPLGRQQAIETMGDPIVIIDEGGQIVDSNPAVRRLVGIESGWRGLSTDEFFADYSDLVERLRDTTAVDTEISIETENGDRYFDLSISPIERSDGATDGRLLVARDVTRLKSREQELDLLGQVQRRVLRHNLRNDLQVIRGQSEQLKRTDGNEAEIAETIMRKTDSLLSISDKTRTAERLIEQDQDPITQDIAETVRDVVDDNRRAFPSVTFSLSCPEQCQVEAVGAMPFVVDYLVENAAEHNAGPSQSVAVDLGETEETIVLTISDDGPGIPEQELSVLDAGEETPLKHAKGVGLWVVQWIIDASAATIEFETGTAGTTVTITMPAADAVEH